MGKIEVNSLKALLEFSSWKITLPSKKHNRQFF